VEERRRWGRWTRLSLPGDRRLEAAVDWGKQNILDLTRVAEDLEIRWTDQGKRFPPPEGAVARARWMGAGLHSVERLDEDGDGWPEGSGNVERSGMGGEKLDNAVYLIRGLYDLADMARSRSDGRTYAWARKHARRLQRDFETTWRWGSRSSCSATPSRGRPGSRR
jgi:hypothetical protein